MSDNQDQDKRIVLPFPGQEAIRAKYPIPKECKEISGFGGGYEATCINMMYAALQVLDPIKDIVKEKVSTKQTTTVDQVNDLTNGEMEKAVMAACHNDCTGAMHGSSIMHAIKIIELGLDTYVKLRTSYKCSYCGRDEGKFKRLISNKDYTFHCCNECIDIMYLTCHS